MPPEAVLTGILLLLSFFASHCSVAVPSTTWMEPALLWITICMPTGSGKSPLYGFLRQLVTTVRNTLGLTNLHLRWLLDEASLEKMGDLMAANDGKMLGLYDELSSFLSQMNIFRGKENDSTFLSLYNAKSWSCTTG